MLKQTRIEISYYPVACNFENAQFSFNCLPDFAKVVEDINTSPYVHNHWIYCPQGQQINIFDKAKLLPYSPRVFDLPKTHVLIINDDLVDEEVDFLLWYLSFFTGMRLTNKKYGFLDATPIKPYELVHFNLSHCDLSDIISNALTYIEEIKLSQLSKEQYIQRLKQIGAAIHCLFMAQYPQNMCFERFQYLYAAMDACFNILKVNEPKTYQPHAQRIEWMCEKLGIATPSWAVCKAKSESSKKLESPLSLLRNFTVHEGLFFDQPLGFATVQENYLDVETEKLSFHMGNLICRFLVAIMIGSDNEYMNTSIEARIIPRLNIAKN